MEGALDEGMLCEVAEEEGGRAVVGEEDSEDGDNEGLEEGVRSVGVGVGIGDGMLHTEVAMIKKHQHYP